MATQCLLLHVGMVLELGIYVRCKHMMATLIKYVVVYKKIKNEAFVSKFQI